MASVVSRPIHARTSMTAALRAGGAPRPRCQRVA